MTMAGSEYKVYVEVIADFRPDGSIQPLCVIWEAGRRFEIDRVTDRRRAASLKAGGTGWRYTCMICGRPHYLFYEESNRWFVERRSA